MASSAITTKPTPSEVEVLTPVESLCQPRQAVDDGECHASEDNIDFKFELEGDDSELEDDDSDSEEEPKYYYLPRGKQVPKTSGSGGKKGDKATRPSKDKKTGDDKKAEEKKKDGKK